MHTVFDIDTRLDPELATVRAFHPNLGFDLTDIEGSRSIIRKVNERLPVPAASEVILTNQRVQLPAKSQSIDLLIIRPTGISMPDQRLPVLLWFHGGGYCMGSARDNVQRLAGIARQTQCAVISVDYRLAPENPYPAALDDGVAAFEWVVANGKQLGCATNKVAVGGASAGAGLAAAVALFLRDKPTLQPKFQLLIYPMLDDRGRTPSSYAITDSKLWNRETNSMAWALYHGEQAGRSDVPAYAAPSRATDLSRLPPAFIAVGDLDIFLDENVEYASRLGRSGVPAELHVYPGAIHGFDILAPTSHLAAQINHDVERALVRAWAT